MPVEIADWNDLDNVRNDLSGDYVLVNDLDSETDGYAGIGDDFEPIGFIEDDQFTSEFGGSFDGDGFEIADLVIEYDGLDDGDIGLFASTDDGSMIENLSVDGSVMVTDSEGNHYSGLVGYHTAGTIQNCVSHVDVTAPDGGRVGGLVGRNDSTVTESYATGSVEGDNRVGGLVGLESSDNSDQGIDECYSSNDSVTGNDDVGAFCGRLGAFTGIGDDAEGYIFDSYVDIELSNQSEAIGNVFAEGASDVEEKQTAEMQGSEAETNMDGFDFANVWDAVLESDDDTTADGYPILLALDRENQLEAQGIFQELQPPEPPQNLTAELL